MNDDQELGKTRPELVPSTELLLAKPSETIADPHCFGLQELSGATALRARVSKMIREHEEKSSDPNNPSTLPSDTEDISSSDVDTHPNLSPGSPLFIHLSHGLAYTVGSALGTTPPSLETCLAAYLVPNSVGLTAGARAWSKHCHRSQPTLPTSDSGANADTDKKKRSIKPPSGWWGRASGPQAVINANALVLFHKVMDNATWRNLHWLPHQVLVYEVRVSEGYGMRWSQDQGDPDGGVGIAQSNVTSKEVRPWIFRGFLEPTMENGHELKWRHPE